MKSWTFLGWFILDSVLLCGGWWSRRITRKSEQEIAQQFNINCSPWLQTDPIQDNDLTETLRSSLQNAALASLLHHLDSPQLPASLHSIFLFLNKSLSISLSSCQNKHLHHLKAFFFRFHVFQLSSDFAFLWCCPVFLSCGFCNLLELARPQDPSI